MWDWGVRRGSRVWDVQRESGMELRVHVHPAMPAQRVDGGVLRIWVCPVIPGAHTGMQVLWYDDSIALKLQRPPDAILVTHTGEGAEPCCLQNHIPDTARIVFRPAS